MDPRTAISQINGLRTTSENIYNEFVFLCSKSNSAKRKGVLSVASSFNDYVTKTCEWSEKNLGVVSKSDIKHIRGEISRFRRALEDSKDIQRDEKDGVEAKNVFEVEVWEAMASDLARIADNVRESLKMFVPCQSAGYECTTLISLVSRTIALLRRLHLSKNQYRSSYVRHQARIRRQLKTQTWIGL